MQWTWSFSGYLHLGTILLIPIYSSLSSCTLLHLSILYYMYSWLQKEAGLETICTVEVLGAPWLYCVFWFTELVHSVVCGEWLQSYSTCLSPIPQQLAEVLILAISARELTFYRGAEANYAPTPGMGMPGVEAGRPNPGDLARETEPETWARSIFIPLADDVTPS